MEIQPIWEELKDSVVITDISDFTQRIKAISDKYDYSPFISWVNLLEKQISMFDLDKIHETLKELPEIISNIKSKL